jgi:thioredoxin reductase
VDVYHGKTTGHNAVVTASEWEVGCCDVALYLSEQGKKTTLLFSHDLMETMTGVAAVAYPADMMALWEVMPQRGIEIHYGMKVKEVNHGAVVASDKEGRKSTFPADTVVVVPKFISNDSLAKELTKRKMEVHTIGDCVEPRRIYHAIHEGHAIGHQL